MVLRKLLAQLLVQADLDTGELVGIPESLVAALVKTGLISSWERIGTYHHLDTGRLTHIAQATLTEKGVARARQLKANIRCPRSEI